MSYIDMTGQKYGRLTPQHREPPVSGRRDTSARWYCRCDCGGHTVASRHSLVNGRILSCGCVRIEQNRTKARERRLPQNQAAFNKLLRRYEYQARTRGIPFRLTEIEFRVLISAPCFYCGVQAHSQMCTLRKPEHEATLRFNGIDRLDNRGPYEMDNCVPCCGPCNFAKKDRSVEEFKEHVLRIVKHMQWSN